VPGPREKAVDIDHPIPLGADADRKFVLYVAENEFGRVGHGKNPCAMRAGPSSAPACRSAGTHSSAVSNQNHSVYQFRHFSQSARKSGELCKLPHGRMKNPSFG
jgi:hypothetical protein